MTGITYTHSVSARGVDKPRHMFAVFSRTKPPQCHDGAPGMPNDQVNDISILPLEVFDHPFEIQKVLCKGALFPCPTRLVIAAVRRPGHQIASRHETDTAQHTESQNGKNREADVKRDAFEKGNPCAWEMAHRVKQVTLSALAVAGYAELC